MNDCIFCKIIEKNIPSKIRYEDDKYLVFDDINPKAPTHLLIIPKEHIKSVDELSENNIYVMSDITRIAQKIAKEMNISDYKLITNCGEKAGQIVFHLHVHFLGYSMYHSPTIHQNGA